MREVSNNTHRLYKPLYSKEHVHTHIGALHTVRFLLIVFAIIGALGVLAFLFPNHYHFPSWITDGLNLAAPPDAISLN